MADSNYILGQVIARGGMAEVYRGLQVGQDGFRRLVAIKRILPQHANNTEFAEMFRDEAHIGQRLQHANLVKVEGYDVIDGSPSIVMEFVDGTDLRSVLSEIEKSRTLRRLPLPMALYVIAEAARGLHYAHIRHDDVTGRPLEIVHRDISPQNILVSFNGEIKVTDFGIAALDKDFKSTETKAGIVKGKYSYMSPEQISAKRVDARTDIFALSIVLWEVIAMRRLFNADNEVEVIDLVKNCRTPGRLRDFNKEVSEELEQIVMRGLAKDPQKRYESMDELERALRSYLSKIYPNFTVGDFSALIKQVLTVKQEASQTEIKKMLTSTNLRAAGKTNAGAIELELSQNETSGKGDLSVSRRPTSFAQQLPRSSSPQSRSKTSQHVSLSSSAVGINANQRTKKSNAGSQMFWTVAVVALIMVGLFFKGQMNAAKDGLSMVLRTAPTTVRVKVNGQIVSGGRYVRTPIRLKLDRGANLVEIIRTGYRQETISVDTGRNEHRSVSPVKLIAKSPMTPTRFILLGNASVQVNVNDGFSVSTLSPAQPVFELTDLSEGLPSDVQISEKGKQTFRCRFIPIKSTERRPFLVTIDPDRASCEARSSKERGNP